MDNKSFRDKLRHLEKDYLGRIQKNCNNGMNQANYKEKERKKQ